MAATVGIGLVAGIAMLISALWFSEGVLKAALLTIGLFWALTTSFTSKWRDVRFWMTIGILFTVHVIAISGVTQKLAGMNLLSMLLILACEVPVMVLTLIVTGHMGSDA
jgi:hypothetical protein